MKRQYQRLAEKLGYDLGFLVQHKIPEHTIKFIAKRQALVLWPNATQKSKNLRTQFISDVVWYSGINDAEAKEKK